MPAERARGYTDPTSCKQDFRLNFAGLVRNTESHNIPGGKQLQRASLVQEEAASTKPPSP